jgi:hypothetical protein
MTLSCVDTIVSVMVDQSQSHSPLLTFVGHRIKIALTVKRPLYLLIDTDIEKEKE